MEFGRKVLSKLGWEEGKGLGKLENGMVAPLKPKLKFDSTGIGFDYGKEYVNDWWAQNYNEALKKVNIRKKKKKERIEENQTEAVNRKKSKIFIKTETLLQDGSHVPEANVDLETSDTTLLDFERLFELCGRRTAHKGARHGLGLSGKLARLEAQEKSLEMPTQETIMTLSPTRNSNSHERDTEQSSKKKKKSKRKERQENVVEVNVSHTIRAPLLLNKKEEQDKEFQGIRTKKGKRRKDQETELEDAKISLKNKQKKRRKLSEEEVPPDLE